MNSTLLGSFQLSHQECLDFAELSGDFNPLHTDLQVARRTQFGGCVVHGISSTLRALAEYCCHTSQDLVFDSLAVQYGMPIKVDQRVDVYHTQLTSQRAQIDLRVNSRRAQTIAFETRAKRLISKNILQNQPAFKQKQPRSISFEETAKIAGELKEPWNSGIFFGLYPLLSDRVAESQMATLLGTTQLVGMLCPGLNSIFAGFDLKFHPTTALLPSTLAYSVIDRDERFSKIRMSVSDSNAVGTIDAFLRSPPIRQASYNEVRNLLKGREFSGRTALIIGGSRGLGEVAAKLFAAGGGRSLVTYAVGSEDARNVQADITSNGGKCNIEHYDILRPGILKVLKNFEVTDVLYFASPRIQKSSTKAWNDPLYEQYRKYYVDGLEELIEQVAANAKTTPCNLYLPSSAYIDDVPAAFKEYAASKAAAEAFARGLSAQSGGWNVFAPRLPQLLTDQTAGLSLGAGLQTAQIIFRSLKQGAMPT